MLKIWGHIGCILCIRIIVDKDSVRWCITWATYFTNWENNLVLLRSPDFMCFVFLNQILYYDFQPKSALLAIVSSIRICRSAPTPVVLRRKRDWRLPQISTSGRLLSGRQGVETVYFWIYRTLEMVMRALFPLSPYSVGQIPCIANMEVWRNGNSRYVICAALSWHTWNEHSALRHWLNI